MMEMEMKIIQPNPIDAYQPQPTLPFDIDGTLLSKEGKHVIVGAEIEGKKVEFDLRLNEEITQEVGEEVHIEKEKVVSHTIRKEAFGLEGAGEEGTGARDIRRILEELGLSHTVDNVKLIEWMMAAGIELNRDAVHSFVMSEKYLEQLQKELSVELIAKMTLRGMDIEHMNLQELSNSVSKLKNETKKESVFKWLGFERDLNYKEAEQVAKQLYGQKMGKDVYDAIIHLQHFDGELSKKNVNHIIDLLSKIKSLKEISVQTFLAMENTDMDCTIHSLYRIHRSFSMTPIEKNEQSHFFDQYTTKTDNDRTGIERLIHLAGVEKNALSLSIFRELTIQGMTANKENYHKVLKMKEMVEEVLPQLDTKTITALETKGFDVGNTAIEELRLLLQSPVSKLPEEILPTPDISKVTPKDKSEILSKKIGIRELISLIRSDSDMTLNELQDILKSIEITDLKEPVIDQTISDTRNLNVIKKHLTTEGGSHTQIKNETFSPQTLKEVTTEQSKMSESFIQSVPERTLSYVQTSNVIGEHLNTEVIPRAQIKNENFSPQTLKEVTIEPSQTSQNIQPIVTRTLSIAHSLNIIGEHVSTEVISRVHMKNETFSLQTLKEATIEQSRASEILIQPVPESTSILIQEEYMRIRSGLTISIIGRSIRENFDLEHASLSQVNAFLRREHQAYEQAKEFHRRLKNTVGQSKILIPTIMTNSLDMDLQEILNLSHFFNGTQQLDTSVEALKMNGEISKKDMIKQLEKKLSDKIHTGKPFVQEYQALIQAKTDFSGKNSKQEHSKDHSDSLMLGTVKKLSRGTIVMQIPIELEGKENRLNVLIPRKKHGLSKKEMCFFLSLRTEKLGTVNMALEVSGKKIYLKFDEKNHFLENKVPKLRETLSDKGYHLKVEN